MADVKVYSADEVLEIVKKEVAKRVQAKIYPYHVVRYYLFKEYGANNIRPGLRELVRTRRLKMGNTINDFWFQTPDFKDPFDV